MDTIDEFCLGKIDTKPGKILTEAMLREAIWKSKERGVTRPPFRGPYHPMDMPK